MFVMTISVNDRLIELGITVPQIVPPIANYALFVRTGALLFISGQLPMSNGALVHTGKVGATVSVEEGIASARQSALNVVAQIKAACGGDLERVQRIVKITGFVASTPDFTNHPGVINGASDLLVEIFGEKGRHARAAVGCPSLPLDSPVEVEAIVELI
jgi:enamine deaminase RidA (YjgF/YER057c/UK114 family)